jgi:hypothetical protein
MPFGEAKGSSKTGLLFWTNSHHAAVSARRRGVVCYNRASRSEFLTVLGAVLPVFAIMGTGFLIRRLDWLSEEADRSLLRVTINGLLPCLIIDAVINTALRVVLGTSVVGLVTLPLWIRFGVKFVGL